MWSIGELAQRSGTPATTLRYYDRIGLVRAERAANGRRRYPETAIHTLRLVRLCQELGCSLDETAVIMAPGAGDTRAALARTKLAETEGRLRELGAAAAVLRHLVECRHGPSESARCQAEILSLLTRVAPQQTPAAPHGPPTRPTGRS